MMVYHVTRDGSHHVVTVNADTAQDAARIAVIHHGISDWEGVDLRVIQAALDESTSAPYGKTMVGAVA